MLLFPAGIGNLPRYKLLLVFDPLLRYQFAIDLTAYYFLISASFKYLGMWDVWMGGIGTFVARRGIRNSPNFD